VPFVAHETIAITENSAVKKSVLCKHMVGYGMYIYGSIFGSVVEFASACNRVSDCWLGVAYAHMCPTDMHGQLHQRGGYTCILKFPVYKPLMQ
jgi:hypothetical protein